jgi:putative ABC transport system permease protein
MSAAQQFRRAMRSPGFFLTVLALVASVVAVNATAFGALWALGFKALPYGHGDRLVELRADLVEFGFAVGLSESLHAQIAADTSTFDGAVGYASSVPALTDDSGREWRIRRVTSGFDEVLGVRVALGRAFTADDARGDAAVLVLSDTAWRTRFGADSGVLGRELRLPTGVHRVIGVLAPGVVFPDAGADAWKPYVATASEREQDATGNVGGFEVAARLAPGATVAQARARLDAVLASARNLAGLRESSGLKADARAWRDRFSADHWQALALLQLAALALLAVVAVNLANLTIDRMLARRREFAICRALGARQRDVTFAVVGDLLPPTILGTALGLALTPLGTALLGSRGLLPASLPVDVGNDPMTLVIATVMAALAVLFALIVAFAAQRGDVGTGLGQRAQIAGLGRLRASMLVAQVALTTVLLGGSVLLLRSAVNLIDEDRGFDETGVLVTAVDLVGVTRGIDFDSPRDGARFAASVETIRADIQRLPGVTHAAIASMVPFSGWESVTMLKAPGLTEPVQARKRTVGPDYFAAMGIPVTMGREFVPGDAGDASPVIIDELFSERWLAAGDPLAQTIGVANGGETFRDAGVVGVARTVKHESLDEAGAMPTIYQLDATPLPIFMLVTRTAGDPAALADTVRQRILANASDAAVMFNRTLADAVTASLVGRRALVEAVGAFAVATLALAALGLYAVLSFAVRRRTSELGVRMALGADAGRIERMVLGQGGALILGGVAIGLVLGIPLARLLADRLYRLSTADPGSWIAAAALVAIAALVACWLPARMATRVSPRVALESS